MGPRRPLTSPERWILLALPALLVLVADQLTKWWAVRELAPPPDGAGRVVDVVGSLRFLYAENTGMAFSKGAASGRWIGLVVIVVVVAMAFFASRVSSRATVVLLGVVTGGALGNLVDRAVRAENGWLSGAVVDFVDLQWWPVFNVADAAVVVGGILLVFVATREPSGDERAAMGPESCEAGASEDDGSG